MAGSRRGRLRVHNKKPCAICRRWFYPDPRVGDRQHVCGSPACQAERKRRNKRAWRHREASEKKEDVIRCRLHGDTSTQLDPKALRDEVGVSVAVALEECARLQLLEGAN